MNRNDHHFYRQKPTPCLCEEPFGDERDMTCSKCGRQVNGRPLPVSGVFSLTSADRSLPAIGRRKYRPAA